MSKDNIAGIRHALNRAFHVPSSWHATCINEGMKNLGRLILGGTLIVGMAGAAESAAKLAAVARTPSDHVRVADMYRGEAKKYQKDAERYRELAAKPARMIPNEGKHPMAPGTRGHSLFFAQKSDEKAKEAFELEARHRQLAERAAQVNVE
jgi:hypothetical protein